MRALGGLREELRGVSWVSPLNFHLTLKFIGETEPEREAQIRAVLGQIRVEPFILGVSGLGAFPERGNPKVVWAGVEPSHPRLFQLQHRVVDALFRLGIEPERRVYSPHITVARTLEASPQTVRQFLKRHGSFACEAFRVERFGLWRTLPAAGGGVHYGEVEGWPLVAEGEQRA